MRVWMYNMSAHVQKRLWRAAYINTRLYFWSSLSIGIAVVCPLSDVWSDFVFSELCRSLSVGSDVVYYPPPPPLPSQLASDLILFSLSCAIDCPLDLLLCAPPDWHMIQFCFQWAVPLPAHRICCCVPPPPPRQTDWSDSVFSELCHRLSIGSTVVCPCNWRLIWFCFQWTVPSPVHRICHCVSPWLTSDLILFSVSCAIVCP